jgi:hypothetical protein
MRAANAVATAAVVAALAGCGGSGAPAASVASASPSFTPAATLPAHTGLVGAVDSARRLALCENARLYATTVEGGLSVSADEAFDAIIQTLRQAPRDPALLALAARWQVARDRVGDTKMAKRLAAFCAKA